VELKKPTIILRQKQRTPKPERLHRAMKPTNCPLRILENSSVQNTRILPLQKANIRHFMRANDIHPGELPRNNPLHLPLLLKNLINRREDSRNHHRRQPQRPDLSTPLNNLPLIDRRLLRPINMQAPIDIPHVSINHLLESRREIRKRRYFAQEAFGEANDRHFVQPSNISLDRRVDEVRRADCYGGDV
jgi:hypothetical protein